ncbi:MAG: FAD-dependent oxidoreductase [Caldilineaceae bacterium]
MRNRPKLRVFAWSAAVVAVQQDGQGVSDGVTVNTPAGEVTVQTRTLINAAGPFLPHIARMAGVDLPVFSVFQQKIAMPDPLGILPRHAPFTIFLDGQEVAWRDEERAFWASDDEYAWLLQHFPGGLHIRPEGSGDSTWIKLGWAINAQAAAPVWSPQGSPEFPELLLRGVARFIPGFARYAGRLPQSLVHYGGYYTKTKENLPLIGPMGVSGSYVVGALSGYGTMAGCAAGELCAQWVTASTLPNYAEVLSLARYAQPRYQAAMALLENSGEL